MHNLKSDMITVKVHSNERTVYIPYGRSDSILTVKRKLEQMSDILVENQILFLSGHLIPDNVVMEEVINSNSRVIRMDLDVAVRGGASNIVPLIAPDMTSEECFEKRNFATSGPDYRTISKGINLECYCQNIECIAFKDLVDVQLGMCEDNHGVSNYAEIMFELPCPACKELIDHKEIHNILFLNCITKIKFKVYEGERVEEIEINAPSYQYLALKDPEKFLKYHYIKFTLK